MGNDEMEEQRNFIRSWAWRKMQKLERKLKRYAKMYFEESVAIVYAKNGSKIISSDGELQGVILLEEQEQRK